MAPIVPTIVMGHNAEQGGQVPVGERLERRKSLAASVRSWRGKRNEADDLPPGWTKEDEEAEKQFLAQGMFDWQSMKSWRFWIRKEWWCECDPVGWPHDRLAVNAEYWLMEDWYVAAIILAVLVALMALFHDDVSGFALAPVSKID